MARKKITGYTVITQKRTLNNGKESFTISPCPRPSYLLPGERIHELSGYKLFTRFHYFDTERDAITFINESWYKGYHKQSPSLY